jgi:hypothetical protein
LSDLLGERVTSFVTRTRSPLLLLLLILLLLLLLSAVVVSTAWTWATPVMAVMPYNYSGTGELRGGGILQSEWGYRSHIQRGP